MDLIEQYIHAVISYLPKSLKNKARKMIKQQIEEGLPMEHTELDIHNELQKLGSPSDFARHFREEQYLIGPNYYPQYLAVSQKSAPALFLIIMLFATASSFFMAPSENLFFVLANRIFFQPLNVTLQFILWVTVTFIILEKKNIPVPESILIIPKPKQEAVKKIPKKVTLLINGFLTLGGMFLIQFYSHFIALYTAEGILIPLFVSERLTIYLPYLFALGAVQLIFIGTQANVETWDIKLAMTNTLYNISIFIFLVIFMTDSQLFNPEFLDYFLPKQYPVMFLFLTIAFLFCAMDSIKGFKKKKFV